MKIDTSPFEGLIFDCDGTLADSMPLHYVTWKATMDSYGIPFPEDRFYALGGVPTEKIVAMLAEEHGKELDAKKVADEKDKMFHDMEDQIEPRKAVVEIAKQNRGVKPMAVASGSLLWSVEGTLKTLGIQDWFDAVVCADHITNPKPDPEIFLTAAEKISVDPKKCCVFEDTNFGLQAAEAAGMVAFDVRGM